MNMYHKYYSRPILKGAVFEIGKFPPIFDNQLSIARDEMDFVRRTKMGINEIRQLRRCSRSGVCTQSRHPSLLNNLSTISKNDFCIKMTLDQSSFLLGRQDSPLSVWDHRFSKRSFCGGLWTRGAPKLRKRHSPNNLVQEILQ